MKTEKQCPARVCSVSTAQYVLGFVDGLYVTLQDKNTEGDPNACRYAKSLRNDMERVIRELSAIFPYLDEYRLVYRNSMGRWNGVVTHRNCFTGFKPLDAASFEEARAAIEGGLEMEALFEGSRRRSAIWGERPQPAPETSLKG